MKLRNKKIAAIVLAAVFAAAMPVSAFAEESSTDVAATSLMDVLGETTDLENWVNAVKSGNSQLQNLTGAPSVDEIKTQLEAYFGESIGSIDTSDIKEYLEAFNKVYPDTQLDIEDVIAQLKGTGSTTAPSTDSTTASSTTSTTKSDKYIIMAEAAKAPYLVYPGYDVELPKTATVTYNDGSKEEVPVTWTEYDGSPVDAKSHDTIFPGTENEYGYFLIYGTVANYNVKIVKGVRITAKAPKPTESTTTTTEATTTTTEATTTTTEAATTTTEAATTTTTDTVIENVQTGEGNYSMVWVMFMFSAAALAVTTTSRKFRCA